jgi:hypothetical protein
VVNTTSISKFQAAMTAEREADEQLDQGADPYDGANPLDGLTPHPDGVSAPISADSDIFAEQTGGEESGYDGPSAPTPMAVLAEKMARDRSTNPDSGDAFEGMDLDVDPADAFGLVQANVIAWLEEHGRWATPIEIRHKTEQLMQAAQEARPGPVGANGVYTVEAGVVTGFTPDAAPADVVEQAEMPGTPPADLKVPKSDQFDSDGWADSTALHKRALLLIERHPDDLEHLETMTLGFLWKLKGGKSRGRPVLGRCVKPDPLLKHFSGSTFLIWLAADHVLAARYRDREIEALLFRQLLAAGVAEPDEDTGRGGGATLVPPDVEAYAAELRVYGLWEAKLKAAAVAFRQAPLFDATVPAADDDSEDEYDSEIGREEAAQDGYVENPLSGAGILIHDDGSPLTEQEIAEQEASELRDDPAEFDDDEADKPTLTCSVCGEGVYHDELTSEEAAEAETDPSKVLCDACSEAVEAEAGPD